MMAAEKWPQVKEILDAAIRRRPEERAAFLDEACEGDEGVRREVESLLSSFGKAEGFMERPAVGAMSRKITQELTPLARGQVIGRYEIERELGVGGMGVVYLAHDKTLERRVAIKVLNKRYERHEENVRRFVREAKAASALNHPNILTIYEIVEFEGSHYIVSEYVEGLTLREMLGTERLDVRNAADILVQIASALAAAHKARIIHRDVKPDNVIVREDGYVKVLDFGLAKLLPLGSAVSLDDRTLRQNETAEGVIMGTVSYMSPEQAKGEAVDERTDIFSLGIVMYEMIAGRTPFAADSTSETFANLINKDPTPLRHTAPGVPEQFEKIVAKALCKGREDRYQTMTELLDELKDLKDKISVQPQNARASRSELIEETAILSRTTGDIVHTTDAPEIPSSRIRGRLLIAALFVVLFGGIALAWYWQKSAAEPPVQIKSLAVLPLKSLDQGENYIGFGVADAVIRRISQTGALTVRPTSAVKRYMTEDADALTAAKDLGVDAILEGTLQRQNDRLRITVNLLRTADGASLWTEKYDTQSAEIFAVQDKVAQQVAARLQLQLDPAQQARLAKRTTGDPAAYENYIKGVYSFNQRRFDDTAREQIDATIGFLKKATELDPKYALAHAKLASAYAWKGLFIDTEDQERLLDLAQEEINAADSLDTQLAETHLARSRLLFSEHGGWRMAEAARECLMAQQIDPNLGHEEISDIYVHMGLEDLTDREIRIALEKDPTSDWVKLQMYLYYILLNRYDDYLIVKNEFYPEEPIQAGYYLVKGDLAKAKESLDADDKKGPPGADPALKAMLFALQGRKRESEALVPTIIARTPRLNPAYHHVTYDAACIYAMNGNVPSAMKWLRETAALGNPSYTLFTRDPFLDKIRKSPEFIQFMADLKPQYERFRNEFH